MVVGLGHGLRRPVLVDGADLELLEVAAVAVRAGRLALGLVGGQLVRLAHSLLGFVSCRVGGAGCYLAASAAAAGHLDCRAMKIGIIGLGYVGLPLAVAFAEAGHEVVGLDVDPRKIEALERRPQLHRGHPRRRPGAARASASRATADYADLAACDAVIICVPTPLTSSREPDLTYLLDAGDGARRRCCSRASWSCSSRPPTRAPPASGCCRSSRSPGSSAGSDFHLAFSPERIDPGRTDYTVRTTPKLVGGITEACAERARELYALICDEVVVLSTPEAAELSKLLENIFRSVNIALVNELAQLCDRLGIDVWEVIDAAATKPFGFMRFDPGPGMGGHCLPVDPFYLAFKAREHDFYPEFIELAGKVNQAQPAFCVERIERALNEAGKPVKGSQDPHPRRQLQGRGRRHPRVAGAEDRRAAARARRRGLLPRPLRPRAAPSSASASVDLDGGAAPRPTWSRSSPPTPSSTTRTWSPTAPLVIDFRGVTRGIDAENLDPPLGLGSVDFPEACAFLLLLDHLGDQLDHVGVAGGLDVAGLDRPCGSSSACLSRPAR